jgi:hypothetical protein
LKLLGIMKFYRLRSGREDVATAGAGGQRFARYADDCNVYARGERGTMCDGPQALLSRSGECDARRNGLRQIRGYCRLSYVLDIRMLARNDTDANRTAPS